MPGNRFARRVCSGIQSTVSDVDLRAKSNVTASCQSSRNLMGSLPSHRKWSSESPHDSIIESVAPAIELNRSSELEPETTDHHEPGGCNRATHLPAPMKELTTEDNLRREFQPQDYYSSKEASSPTNDFLTRPRMRHPQPRSGSCRCRSHQLQELVHCRRRRPHPYHPRRQNPR